MAGLLVASTVGVNAESLNPSRAYEFRAADVQAAVPFKTVKKIDPNKWYQLRTTEFYGNEALRMPGRPYSGSEVLVHYRDLFTGEVYLRAVPAVWNIRQMVLEEVFGHLLIKRQVLN